MYKFNPFTGKLDNVNPTGTAVSVSEYTTDPVSPSAGDLWVLRTDPAGDGDVGQFRILGIPMFYAGTTGVSTYQLSYRTEGATTIRTTLT